MYGLKNKITANTHVLTIQLNRKLYVPLKPLSSTLHQTSSTRLQVTISLNF